MKHIFKSNKLIFTMKNINTNFVTLIFTFFTFTAFAQIKVNANGESKLGNEWSGNDYNNEATHEFFGLNSSSYRPGTLISMGDYGSTVNGGANVYIAEAFGWDSDQLDLHGKNGIYFTVNGTNGSIIGAELTGYGDFIATRDVSAVSYITRSDIRLKTNVRNLNSALASVMQLQGLTYDFKSIKEDATLTILNNIEAKTEKDIRDLANAKKGYEDKKLGNLNHIGFSAQEVADDGRGQSFISDQPIVDDVAQVNIG